MGNLVGGTLKNTGINTWQHGIYNTTSVGGTLKNTGINTQLSTSMNFSSVGESIKITGIKPIYVELKEEKKKLKRILND
jgi:hypothetical protein